MSLRFEVTIFLILLVFLVHCAPAFAVVNVQYNQSSVPEINVGGSPSGDYNDLNVLGEGLTYDIPEDFRFGSYSVDVWHNSSQIDEGNIDSINVTINFTTNVSDDYSLNIYDWFNDQWDSTGCSSGSVLADVPTQWWCNITSNAMNYNSSDRRIMIEINSTGDADAGLLSEDYVQYYAGYLSYLEVNMTDPDPTSTLNVIQNETFIVNVSVTCKDGPCGQVFGTVFYNYSSNNPDTPVNTTQGDIPFFINEIPANSKKACGTLISEDYCYVEWLINATGSIGSVWKHGVLFNSTYAEIRKNHTDNATIAINDCPIDLTVQWGAINFGLLNPSTDENSAVGNDGNEYNITVNGGSCALDIYINGSNLTNTTLGYEIDVSSISWSNTTNDYAASFPLSYSVWLLRSNVLKNNNVTTWYWINVPPVYTGYYNGSISIWGVKYGQVPP